MSGTRPRTPEDYGLLRRVRRRRARPVERPVPPAEPAAQEPDAA
jgi:hypothetical protein